jgi:hypothetical protein
MGRERLEFEPMNGLVKLFSKTGMRKKNPKLLCTTQQPPLEHPPPKRSYVDVLRAGMENDNSPTHGNRVGGQRAGNNGGPRGVGQAEAYTRGGSFQRPYPFHGGGGSYRGPTGQGRRFEQWGRGYDGQNRFQHDGNPYRREFEISNTMTHPRREQGTRDEAPQNINHQWRPDARQENVIVGTLKTRYPRVQVPGQDKRQGMQITRSRVSITSA